MAIVGAVEFKNLLEYRFDSECYRPDLQDADRRIKAMGCRPMVSVASVSDGNHISIASSFCDSGVRYLKGGEVADVFIDDSNPTYIPESVYSGLKRSHVSVGDVLLSVVGSVGPVALVTDKYQKLSCSCKLAILRPHGISGAMLTAYLLSPTGQSLLLRRNRGSVQQGVILPDLREFPVPHFDKSLATKVEKLMGEIAADKRNADSFYPSAQAELMDRFKQKKPSEDSLKKFHAIDFRDIEKASRFDPEFYRASPELIRQSLKNNGAKTIGELCHFSEHGIQPPYVEGGNVGVVSQRQFRATCLRLDLLENFTAMDFVDSNPQFAMRSGDVLTYCVSAGEYLGRTFLFDSTIPCVAASFVTILRTAELVPGYLAVFLNSPLGLIQSNTFKRGTSPFYLYPRDLRNVLIGVPRNKNGAVDTDWQNKIAAMAHAASEARESSQAKLSLVKNLVEKYLSKT